MLNRMIVTMVMLAAVVGCAGPREVAFRMHTINAESKFEAASVFDVNRDGRVDIFCGGHWYEGPTWTKHAVREVEEKDNYYYDFSNLPIDADGDGWTDVVSCAWHNRRLFWVKNPGRSGVPFETFTIDEPGNVETAVAADLNGDGRMDVIPCLFNGPPAWYEYAPDAAAPGGARWSKHLLPKELEGAGMGTADLNGDGRLDIVGGKGWAEQPADPTGDWIWHGEWDLIDSSIPVQVHDIDEDGDLDVIWGIGHNYGLYWLEQGRGPDGGRTWTRHEIDKSWSQAHVVLLGDLNGDRRPELVTGKRYHAHNGKDPGGNDPRCLYYYTFDRPSKTWTRHVIQESGPAGIGLSTELVDIDADGDLDLIAPGKSGLYLFENLRR